MSRQQFSITSILLLLSILTSFTTATYTAFGFLIRRQQIDPQRCEDYSRTANFSTIGSNATYRAAYLDASPEGSDPARAPLDSAMARLPTLQFDVDLNAQCGNLTEVAFEGAETNFTQGIVLQFRVGSAPRIGPGAMGLAVVAATLVYAAVEMM
ncbi:hypothetical protein B0A52_02318 [Exophiala mesophila]|uniref:Uncharacterized protein n=1 Tax=Exophiala mesophila TaxID=212818 RepID=A0A438NC64_EXOME|nr:hypothetical protein B0A52_02318 [Exophiala mesophila]